MADDFDFALDGSEWSNDDTAAPVAVQSPPAPPTPPAAPAVVEPPKPRWESAADRRRNKGAPQPLYFDIETCPDYSRIDSFNLDPLPDIPEEDDISKMPDPEGVVAKTVDDAKKQLERIACPPGAWLDQVADAERCKDKPRSSVFDLIAKAREKRQDVVKLHEGRRLLLSTTPEFCRIVSIAWAIGGGETQSVVVGQESLITGPNGGGASEGQILSLFWQLAAQNTPLVGFNVLGFDLPVIFVRSAILGVPASKMLDLKPWGRDVCDVYALRFPKGASDGRPRKLKALCPLYGIEVPAGDCDGSMVEELLEKDPAKLAKYNESDVEVTRAFHRSLSGFFWA